MAPVKEQLGSCRLGAALLPPPHQQKKYQRSKKNCLSQHCTHVKKKKKSMELWHPSIFIFYNLLLIDKILFRKLDQVTFPPRLHERAHFFMSLQTLGLIDFSVFPSFRGMRQILVSFASLWSTVKMILLTGGLLLSLLCELYILVFSRYVCSSSWTQEEGFLDHKF